MPRTSLAAQACTRLLAGVGLAWALACGGSPQYCDTVQVVISPDSFYPDTVLPDGVPAAVLPVTRTNGPITSSSLLSGSLPPGLALQPDGAVTGTPTLPGTYLLTIRLCNAKGGCVPAALNLRVVPAAPLSLGYASPLTLPAATAIPPQAPALANATPGVPTTYALTQGGLPTGLALDPATGILSGTPTVPAVYTFTVTATNGLQTASADVAYTIVPAGSMVANYPTPQTFTQGVAITAQACSVLNDTPGVVPAFALASGSLPPGLSLNPDGTLTGTPTAVGVSTFTVTVTSALRSATTGPVTYTVVSANPMTASYATPQTFTQGVAIAPQACAVTDPTPGVATTFLLAGGALPPGLVLNPDGTLTGTPTTVGLYTFTVTVVSAARTASTGTVAYTVVSSSPMAASYPTPQTFTQGGPIPAQACTVVNATPGLTTTFALAGGSLPPGLVLAADGTLAGTPTATGVYSFTVTATSGSRLATTPSTDYTVVSSNPMVASYATPQTFTQGSAIPSQACTVLDPTPGVPTTFALSGGGLPPGLVLNPDGSLTGTPPTTGVFTFTVTATSAARSASTGPVTYTVAPAAAMGASYATPQTFTQGSAIPSQACTVTNPTPGLATTFALASGALPPGLVLNAGGDITGIPTTPGIYTFGVTATSGLRSATTPTATYTVMPSGAMTASYATPQTFTLGLAIAVQACLVANPTPGLTTTFSVSSGVLPAGLVLNADGTLTGTPTVTGVFLFAVTATSGARSATTPTVSYTVAPSAPMTASYGTPRTFTEGSPIPSQPCTVTNPTPGVVTSFLVSSGSLPPGLVLSPSGAITGTPTTPGLYTFAVTATSAARSAITNPVTYTVVSSNLMTASYATPQAFTQGSAIPAQACTVTDPTPGLTTTFGLASGSLPPGLVLNADGSITGTPTTVGLFTFTVLATSGSRVATTPTATYSVASATPMAASYPTPQTFTQGSAIPNQACTVTDGTPGATPTFALAGGTLPPGLALNPDGTITGTPTAAGAYLFTVNAVSGARSATTPTVTWTVVSSSAMTASYASPRTLPFGVAASLACAVANDTPGVTPTFALASGTLPPGLSLGFDGTIAGTPSALGSATFTVKVDSAARTATTAAITWTVLDAVVVANAPGGTAYTFHADPGLAQVTLAVPDQAVYDPSGATRICSGDTVLTLVREASLAVGSPLPAGAHDYSHTFDLESASGRRFRVPVTLTLPYDPALSAPNLGGSDLPVPFYWEAAYGRWIAAGLKSYDALNHTVTFTTLLPGRYAILGVPGLGAGLAGAASPAFVTGSDDWRAWDPVELDYADGSALGMASLAAWYQSAWKAAPGNATTPGLGLNSVFAAGDPRAQALIERVAHRTVESWAQVWDQQYSVASGGRVLRSGYGLTDAQTGLALLTAIQVTGQPQLLLMADARPTTGQATAAAVTGYDGAGTFSVVDPNQPGDALAPATIHWDPAANAGAGAFSAYSRGPAYSPALGSFAFEGQPTLGLLEDHQAAYDGATRTSPWQHPPFDAITLSAIGDSSRLATLDQTQVVSGSTGVVIAGRVDAGGDAAAPAFVLLSQNGQPRVAQALDGAGAFSLTLPALADPNGTQITLETASDACDPTPRHSGFVRFKVASQAAWNPDATFENTPENRATGRPGLWVHQAADLSSSASGYPVDAAGAFVGGFDPASGEVTGSCTSGGAYPGWTETLTNPAAATTTWLYPGGGYFPSDAHGIVGGQLLTDPLTLDPHAHTTLGDGTSTYLPMVLAGHQAFRLNDDWNQDNDASHWPGATGTPFYPHLGENLRSAERLAKVIQVPAASAHPRASFWWAAVLQGGLQAHAPSDRPFVDLVIQDWGTGPSAAFQPTVDASNFGCIYYRHITVGGPGIQGWRPDPATAGNQEWISLPWQKLTVDLSAYRGHWIRLYISVSDCVTDTQHAGYAYVDDVSVE